MRSLFICHIFCCFVVSFNKRYTKDTKINTLVPTLSPQILLQLEIIEPSFIFLSGGTAYIIVYIFL